MENNWPETVNELVDECERLKHRYDLYTLGEYGEPYTDEHEPRVDGTEYLAGEYQYGVAMIPAQWVTHVIPQLKEENIRLRSCLSDGAENARQIMGENKQLRELVRISMEFCADGMCALEDGCPLNAADGRCLFDERARELGIEVDD